MTGLSSVYETDPVGFTDQGAFLNMVVRLETALPPRALLDVTRALEVERARLRTFRDAPRTLDVDLLLHGEAVMDAPGLTLPHPRMRDRAFVLAPLVELEPDVRDPLTGRPFAELLDPDAPGIRRLYPGSRLIEGRGDE